MSGGLRQCFSSLVALKRHFPPAGLAWVERGGAADHQGINVLLSFLLSSIGVVALKIYRICKLRTPVKNEHPRRSGVHVMDFEDLALDELASNFSTRILREFPVISRGILIPSIEVV